MPATTEIAGRRSLLLDGDYLPLTSEITFAHASFDETLAALATGWLTPREGAQRVTEAGGAQGLASALAMITPLFQRMRSVVVVRTDRTAVLDNSTLERAEPAGILLRAGLDATAIVESPHTLTWPPRVSPDGRPYHQGWYGEREVRVMRSDGVPGSPKHHRALASLSHDEARWDYYVEDEFGGALVHEPAARQTTDRFTAAHLRATCANLGLEFSDPSWYKPDQGIAILDATTAVWASDWWITLEMARGEVPHALRRVLDDPPPGFHWPPEQTPGVEVAR